MWRGPPVYVTYIYKQDFKLNNLQEFYAIKRKQPKKTEEPPHFLRNWPAGQVF